MLINGLCLFGFAQTKSLHVALPLRGINGLFQAIFIIYGPVWSDSFSVTSLKTPWITILIACAPIGIAIGFSMTAIMSSFNFRTPITWETSFWILAALSVVYALIISSIPEKYFDVHAVNELKNQARNKAREQLKTTNEEVAPFTRRSADMRYSNTHLQNKENLRAYNLHQDYLDKRLQSQPSLPPTPVAAIDEVIRFNTLSNDPAPSEKGNQDFGNTLNIH